MKLKIGILTVGLLTLAGCASRSVSYDQEFLQLSESEREAEINRLRTEREVTAEWKKERLLSGKPVHYGDSDTGYTLQCHLFPEDRNEIAIYQGHKPGDFDSANWQAMAVAEAGKGCAPTMRDVGKGVKARITLRNDSHAQNGFWRDLLMRTGPAILNGTGAAKIASNGRCKGGSCGPTFNVTSQALNQNSSQNELSSDVTVSTNPCPGGQCPTGGPPEG